MILFYDLFYEFGLRAVKSCCGWLDWQSDYRLRAVLKVVFCPLARVLDDRIMDGGTTRWCQSSDIVKAVGGDSRLWRLQQRPSSYYSDFCIAVVIPRTVFLRYGTSLAAVARRIYHGVPDGTEMWQREGGWSGRVAGVADSAWQDDDWCAPSLVTRLAYWW